MRPAALQRGASFSAHGTAVLAFGNPPAGVLAPKADAAAPVRVFYLLGRDQEEHNIRVLKDFFESAPRPTVSGSMRSLRLFPGTSSSNRCLRWPIIFVADSDLVRKEFLDKDHVMKWMAAENAWGDPDLDSADWTPLHLAAFLNQPGLASTVLELDQGVCSVTMKSDVTGQNIDVPAITCIPDALGRLPLDVAMHVKTHLLLRRDEDDMITLLALLSPVSQVSKERVIMRAKEPWDDLVFQFGFFFVLQTLLLIEIGLNSHSDFIHGLCGGAGCLLLLTTVGQLYSARSGARNAVQLPLIGLASRFFLTIILILKAFVSEEQLDYSTLFLGIAMIFEDTRTCNDVVKLECDNYGRRLVVPPVTDDLIAKREASCWQRFFASVVSFVKRFLEFYQLFFVWVTLFLGATVVRTVLKSVLLRSTYGDTEKFVRNRLQAYSSEYPDINKSVDKVETLLGFYAMVLVADIVFITVSATLAAIDFGNLNF